VSTQASKRLMLPVTTVMRPQPAFGLRLRGLLAMGLFIAAAVATAAPAQAATVADSSTIASVATAAAQRAATVRKQASSTLQSYLDDYGDRLSSAERQRVTYWQRTGDRSLRQVQVQSRRTATLARSGASPSRVNAARQSAIAAHAQARRDVDAALTELVPVLSQRLSFLELLQARADLEASLTGLDQLGRDVAGIPVATAAAG